MSLPHNFNFEVYKNLNNDLIHLNNEELRIHYLSYGIKEGRKYSLENIFDINAYRMLNDDLKHFNDRELLQHYADFGIKEGRRCSFNNTTVNTHVHMSHQPSNGKPTRNDFIFVIARYNEDVSHFLEFKDNIMIYNYL